MGQHYKVAISAQSQDGTHPDMTLDVGRTTTNILVLVVSLLELLLNSKDLLQQAR